jgi:CheY-like chemotaxis protein
MDLLDNAAKYTAAGRKITVELGRDANGRVSLVVADEGIGMGADHVARIFDRFYRAHREQRLGGLGLGLYIAREIAERHGGRIEVSSVEGQGSAFTVTLPAPEVTAAVTTAPSVVEPFDSDGLQPKRRILVVDDDSDVRDLVAAVLREAGHTVMTATNGQEALALTARERPDLILLDKLMPVMDGTAFAHAYRERAPDPAPIVAFCAARDAEVWARSIGAVTHVGKPFDVDDLNRTVKQQLEAISG